MNQHSECFVRGGIPFLILMCFLSYPETSRAIVTPGRPGQLTELQFHGKGMASDSLTESSGRIDSIIPIGYGSRKQAEVTGSVVSLAPGFFYPEPVRDFWHLLRGRLPGLHINLHSGNPLDGVGVMLRGPNTLMSEGLPLVIIDGIPGDPAMIVPQDVASITVLKDGSASAIYGSRGANGVVLVTTRDGRKSMPLRVRYSSYIGTDRLTGRPDFFSADDYRRINKEGLTGINDYGHNTDFLKEISRTPMNHMHDFWIGGGTANTWYSGSLNYNRAEGVLLKSDREQLTNRLSLGHELYDGRLILRLGSIHRTEVRSPVNADNAYYQAVKRNPTEPIKDSDGRWFEGKLFLSQNPVALLEETLGEEKSRHTRVYGSVQLSPLENLELKLLLARNVSDRDLGYSLTHNHPQNFLYGNRYASRNHEFLKEDAVEFTTGYGIFAGSHNFHIMGGYSYSSSMNESLSVTDRDFPYGFFDYHHIGMGFGLANGTASMESLKEASRMTAFFGRVQYDFREKYFLMVANRYEGSSRFGAQNRWGHFPAIQAGWRISEEPFMADADFINELKLRTGIGVTGLQPLTPYGHLAQFGYGDNVLINGEWKPSIVPERTPNPWLRWERSIERNIGLDFSLFSHRLRGSLEYYSKRSEDLLWNYYVPVPPHLVNSINANAAAMENRGVELLLAGDIIRSGRLEWNAMLTFASNRNKVLAISGEGFGEGLEYINAGHLSLPVGMHSQRIQPGYGLGTFWGFKSVGLSDDGKWLIETPAGDVVGDINYNDCQAIGNGIPRHTLSWLNRFYYGAFDLNLSFQGAFGFQILNMIRMYHENPGILPYEAVLRNAFDNVFDVAPLNNQISMVSYYIENGNYVKLDNLTLGFSLSPSNAIFQSMRIYASARNLLILTNYQGVDPEVEITGISPGMDRLKKFPSTRSFALGINIVF